MHNVLLALCCAVELESIVFRVKTIEVTTLKREKINAMVASQKVLFEGFFVVLLKC